MPRYLDINQIKQVSEMQGYLLLYRGMLADKIARFSLYCLQNKSSKETKHLEEVMSQSNSEIIQENDFSNIGIHQYVNEIPMELLKNEKQIQALAKKALNWCYLRAALMDSLSTDDCNCLASLFPVNSKKNNRKDLNYPIEALLQEVLYCISHEKRILYPFCGDPQDPFYEESEKY